MSINLILGPMKSGKTTEMLRVAERHKIAGQKVCILRPEFDNRGMFVRNLCVTQAFDIITVRSDHGNQSFLFKNDEDRKLCNSCDVICIDEGQFFWGLREICNTFERMNKIVYISALNGTAEQREWKPISSVIPLAENITFMKAVCEECGKDASFCIYKGGKSEQVVIGDSEYEAVCLSCLQNMKQGI